LPVGLVNPSDITTGTATCNITLDIGTQNSQDYTIGMIASGNYARNSGIDNSVLTVSKNLPGFITGGGYIVASASAGTYAADAGTNTNFGFNVKYNASQTNLQGHANIIIRHTNPSTGALQVLQIKTTAILSMGFGPASNQAQYTAKAVIQDITNPNNVISIAGNQTLQMTITDNGSGSSDTIGFTVWNPAGGLQFSSNWNPSPGRTVEQLLAGGSLVVHSSNQVAAGGPGHNRGITPLTVEQLQPIWTEALARWAKAGATPAQVSPLAQVTVQIVSLPPAILARTGPDTIWISRDAAGYGWFIDPTPSDDGEFNGRPASAAQNRMDLLSVVAHEMGHLVLQMEESAELNDVMTEALPVGVRRMPVAHDLKESAGVVAQVTAPANDSAAALPFSHTVVAALPGSTNVLAELVPGELRPITLDQAFASQPISRADGPMFLLQEEGAASSRFLHRRAAEQVLGDFQDSSLNEALLDQLAISLLR
jgi:hypothetical protein